MDSGNSSSMQSSSGGDDQEYDSRSFLPPPPPPPPQPPPPPPCYLQQSNNLIFNPPPPDPNFLQHFSDRDLFSWPPPNLLRSDPIINPNIIDNNINYLSFTGDSSSATATATNMMSSSALVPPPPPPISVSGPPPKAQNPGPSKNPKKRTRASRRAPTTVLTTDTTNFRAMVQEFTGIPDPPFSAAASAYSRRLDLLGTAGSSMRLATAFGGGGNPLRPTAQRLSPSNNIIPSSAPTSFLEVINQGGPGQSGQPDPILAFLQQPHHQRQQLGYQPQLPPISNHNAAFGINIGLLGPENNLSNTSGLIDSQGIGLESSSGDLHRSTNLLRMDPHHQLGRSTGNNDDDNNNDDNYVMMSCGAMTSSPSTDLTRPQGEYRNQ